MEIMDLYDNKKRKLNKTMAREDGEPAEGEFRLSVHVWIINEEGKLLIQKRNENNIRHM